MSRLALRHILPVILLPALLAPAAHAARAGEAPIDAPRRIDSSHATFTLSGNGWLQPVRAESGAPLLGGYSKALTVEGGGECSVFAGVRATGTRVYPSVGKRSVRLRPGIEDELLRIENRGSKSGLRWWSGTQGGEVAAGAVQPAPAALRKRGLRWVVYRLDIASESEPAAEAACRAATQDLGAPVLRSMARSLRLAKGPATGEPPYVQVPG